MGHPVYFSEMVTTKVDIDLYKSYLENMLLFLQKYIAQGWVGVFFLKKQ